MFGKLVKYELKATARVIPIAFAVTILLSFFQLFASKYMGSTVTNLFWFFSVLALVIQFMLVWVILIVRYYKSLHGSEAYLSHTLPVDGISLFFSKYLVSMAWVLASFVIIAGMLTLLISNAAFAEGLTFEVVSEAIEEGLLFLGINMSFPSFLLFVFGILLFTCASNLAVIYTVITIGSSTRLGSLGIGGPVISYIIYYVGMQIINVVTMFAVPIGLKLIPGDPTISQPGRIEFGLGSFWESVISSNAAEAFIPIGSYLISILIFAACMFLAPYFVRKKVNLR